MTRDLVKKHVMIDLETLGKSPGCIVLSIGARTFDKEGVGAFFYEEIDSADSLKAGLFSDKDTLAWWENQQIEAKSLLAQCRGGGDGSVADVCAHFMEFLHKYCEVDFYIWGNGASFDEPILAELLKTIGVRPPWKYYSSRCYRTLHAIGRTNKVPETPFKGAKHNALDDATYQAERAVAIMNALGLEL